MEKAEYQKMSALEDRHWWFLAKREFVMSVLAPPDRKNSKTIVDIGAGTGGMTQFLKMYGMVVGVEPSPYALSYLRRRHAQSVAGRAERLPIKSQSADIACLLDVLYHRNVQSDSEGLSEAYRILIPGGTLLLTDSAFEFLRSAHDRSVQARHRYTKEELVRKVRGAGFLVRKSSYLYWSMFPAVVVQRMLGRRRRRRGSDLDAVPHWLNQLLLSLARIEAFLLRFIAYPWGSSIIIKASKPMKE